MRFYFGFRISASAFLFPIIEIGPESVSREHGYRKDANHYEASTYEVYEVHMICRRYFVLLHDAV
jgi:hypothetical protein